MEKYNVVCKIFCDDIWVVRSFDTKQEALDHKKKLTSLVKRVIDIFERDEVLVLLEKDCYDMGIPLPGSAPEPKYCLDKAEFEIEVNKFLNRFKAYKMVKSPILYRRDTYEKKLYTDNFSEEEIMFLNEIMEDDPYHHFLENEYFEFSVKKATSKKVD